MHSTNGGEILTSPKMSDESQTAMLCKVFACASLQSSVSYHKDLAKANLLFVDMKRRARNMPLQYPKGQLHRRTKV